MELNSTRSDVITRMQSRVVNIDQFNWDHMMAPPLYSLITQDACNKIYQIATSVRYSGNARKRYELIDEVLKPFGFEKKAAGTNRVVYKYLENDTFLLKVAADAVGIGDNPREFKNQFKFKPFVTKVFEVDPTGAVALVERVVPITSREEFMTCANDIYDVIRGWFVGDYILADIGTKFFMNWGIRKGFGPVLLDFPYIYELDGSKLFCNETINGLICNGEIDYDDGYNFLWCQKCGKRYRVQQLAKAATENKIIVKGRESKMKVVMHYGDKVIKSSYNSDIMRESTESVKRPTKPSSTPVGKLQIACEFVPKDKRGRNYSSNDNNKFNNNNDKQQHKDHSSNGVNNRGIVRNNVPTATDDTVTTADPEIENLKNKIEELQNSLSNLQEDYKSKSEELDGVYKDYDLMEKYKDEEAAKVKKLEAEVTDIKDKAKEELESKDNELSLVNLKVENLTTENADLKYQLEELKKTVTNNAHQLSEINDKNNEEKDKINEELESIKEERDKALEDLNKANSTIEENKVKISELEDTIHNLSTSGSEESNDGVILPISSEDLLTEEGREEYTDIVLSAEGINAFAAELTTINAVNLSNNKPLIDEDQYIVVFTTEDGKYLTDADGDVLCMYIIDNIQIREILKNDRKFYETENKVKLIKMNESTVN